MMPTPSRLTDPEYGRPGAEDLIALIERRIKLVDSLSAALAQRKARRERHAARSRKAADTRFRARMDGLKFKGERM